MVEVVYLNNVGMAQLGNYGRFVLKALHKLFVGRQVLVNDFDGHFAAQIRIVGTVNRRHAATSQNRFYFVSSANRTADPTRSNA